MRTDAEISVLVDQSEIMRSGIRRILEMAAEHGEAHHAARLRKIAATVDDIDTVLMANITVLAQKMSQGKLTDLITGCVEGVGVRGDYETAEEMLWPFKMIIDRVLERGRG
jgi:hypothetical protein